MVESFGTSKAAQPGDERADDRYAMTPAEFAVFFQKVFEAADAQEQSRKATGTGVAPAQVLRDFGLDVDLPPAAQARLNHLLTARMDDNGVVRRLQGGDPVAAPECGACGACGVCAACGGANFGAPGAAAAAIWAIL